MDSLVAFRVFSVVRVAMKNSPAPHAIVPRNVVYMHPTITALASYLFSLGSSTSDPAPVDDAQVIQSMIEKYSKDFVFQPELSEERPQPHEGLVVVLTGATGSVGSFILAELLANLKVRLIYSLFRESARHIKDRQLDAFLKTGLCSELIHENLEKMRFVAVDLSQKRLGLEQTLYEEVTSLSVSTGVTVIEDPPRLLAVRPISYILLGRLTSIYHYKVLRGPISPEFDISLIWLWHRLEAPLHGWSSYPQLQPLLVFRELPESRRK